MSIREFIRGAGLAVAALAASFFIVPSAFARVHVGIGVSVPGVAIGIGNCWRCGYPLPAYYGPVYAAPAYYSAPTYYPAPVYYTPRPAYYGFGYYAPYYPRHYYYRGYGHGHGQWSHPWHGGYYPHGHH